MSTNGNEHHQQQPRIIIESAKIVGLLDDFGRAYANSPSIEIAVRGLASARWKYEQIRSVFVAECDGFVSSYSHDGSDRNFGGYGGSAIELDMIDGSKRTIVGPWSGNPSQFYNEITRKFGHMDEVTIYDLDGKIPTVGLGRFWMRMSRIIEACKMIEPVEGKGKSMFNIAPIITPSARVEYALIKNARSGYCWAREDRAAREAHDYPLFAVSSNYSELLAINEANAALRLRAARIKADAMIDDAERRLRAARIEAEPVLREPRQPWAQRIHDVVSGNIPSDYPTVEDREAERSRVHRGSHAEGQGQ